MKAFALILGFMFITSCGGLEVKDVNYKDQIKIGGLKVDATKKDTKELK